MPCLHFAPVGGGVSGAVYNPVRLKIMGPDGAMEVLEAPGGKPVLIGRTALLSLDLVADHCNRRFTGFPAQGRIEVYESSYEALTE